MGLENPVHIIVLVAILLLVFGAKRLPEVGQSLGHGIRGFKDALSGDHAAAALAPAAQNETSAAAQPVADTHETLVP
jgi:sec-independent protein translocase protein TatA